MRHVRFRDAAGVVRDATLAEDEQHPAGSTLLRPIDPPEVWCAGVTYERSRDARIEESGSDVYALVYDADRPELFLKDAGCRRTVGPGDEIAIRSDSTWNVPEPEIGVVLGAELEIAGYTIGNDVSSRAIEGANPLYLPQAKVFAAACAIGPAVYVPEDWDAPLSIELTIRDTGGAELFSGRTSTAKMRRTFTDLVGWLVRDNPVPPGSVLLTGTGLVPPDDFTLLPGHVVSIHVPEIGTLTNPVARATDVLEGDLLPEQVLVTGALGCLGAWVARCVLDDGDSAVGYDLGDDRSRFELVLGDDADQVALVKGDITELAAVERALDEHEITRVVHLAALQVPFVRANPPLGMHVNVAGTVNVFDAVSRRLERIPGVAYASSAAVYNPADPSPAPETGGTRPETLYGVSKLADEGVARVYHADAGVPSIGLRPYVVYGPGRDQGMTSGPTVAMLAAVRGEPFHIGFSGAAQYDFVPDVARAIVRAAHSAGRTAAVYNVPGVLADVANVVSCIEEAVPGAEITWSGDRLPFPPALEAVGFDRDVGPFPRTTLADGVAATVAHFRRTL